jgi:hypothetical protein
MEKPETLGEFEQTVLLAIAHLDDRAYGVTIRRDIETRTGRAVSIGALVIAFSLVIEQAWPRQAL